MRNARSQTGVGSVVPVGNKSGAALVTTVIVVAVLAVVAVAFMQSNTADLTGSRSVVNHLRAQMAAEAGLAEALWTMSAAIGTNPASARNFIVSETNPSVVQSPVLLIGSNEASVATNMVPLISGDILGYLTNRSDAALTAFVAKRITADPKINADMNLREAIQTYASIPVAAASNWWSAPWVMMTNIVNSPDGPRTNLARYAFIVVDEQGCLNPFFHQGMAGLARTNYGRTASEIRVDSAHAPIITNAAKVAAISNAGRSVIATSDTLGLGDLLGEAYRTNKHLVSIHSAIDEDIIPAGYLTVVGATTNFVAYNDAGKPKYNLNDLATNNDYGSTPEARATYIANILSRNLTNFFSRDKGSLSAGLSDSLYVSRLSASIVDYVDSDDFQTIGVDGVMAGKELNPYVVLVAEKNTWISELPPAPASNNITVKIGSQFFVQLWNPTTNEITGSVSLAVTNRQLFILRNGGPQRNFADYNAAPVNVTLRPNEMKSVTFPVVTEDFVHPSLRPSLVASNAPTWTNTSSASSSLNGHPQFTLYWNGAVVDKLRAPPAAAPANAGLSRVSPGNSFRPVGVVRWSFNCAPDRSGAGGGRVIGDPRGNVISSYDWANAGTNFANFLWQGRQDDVSSRQQNFSVLWNKRDFIRSDLPLGTAIPSANADPTLLPSTWTTEAGWAAPAVVRNSPMASTGQLGDIFDPAQVDDSGTAPSAGTPANFFGSVGGRSLRVGQPESPYWDVGGLRASQLLDLFTVNPLGTNVTELGTTAYMNTPVMRGRINVNTAPKQVLAAVFEGLTLTSDQGIGTPLVNAFKMADAVISNRPYSRLSDLSKVSGAFANGSNYTPVVANVSVTISNAVNGTSTNYIAMGAMDRAREELFARTLNLFGTQSRAFRIYVVGEALDRSTNPVSHTTLEAAIELEAQPGEAVLDQVIKWKKFL